MTVCTQSPHIPQGVVHKFMRKPCKIAGIAYKHRASGAMDNASAYGAEDSRFDSWLARQILWLGKVRIPCYFISTRQSSAAKKVQLVHSVNLRKCMQQEL